MIVDGPIEVVARIIDILLVVEGKGIFLNIIVCIIREEESVPRWLLSFLLLHLVSIWSQMSLHCCSLCNIKTILWNHCGIRLEIRSVVPHVSYLSCVSGLNCKENTTSHACYEEIPSEHVSWKSTWININEVMHESLLWNNRDSSLVSGHSSTYPNSKRPCKHEPNSCIYHIRELMLPLNFPLILPWPSLWSSHELSESVCNPWIISKLVSQPNEIH